MYNRFFFHLFFSIRQPYVEITAKTSSDLKIVDLAIKESKLNLLGDSTAQLHIMRYDQHIDTQFTLFF